MSVKFNFRKETPVWNGLIVLFLLALALDNVQDRVWWLMVVNLVAAGWWIGTMFEKKETHGEVEGDKTPQA